MRLGAILFVTFLSAFGLRVLLEGRIVSARPAPDRPRRQFYLDISLWAGAGLASGLYNGLFNGFPVSSGAKLVFGCLALGFFFSLEAALARERSTIRQAIDKGLVFPLSRVLYPMTQKFSLMAVAATILVSVTLALVFSQDLAWIVEGGDGSVSASQARLTVLYEIGFVMAVLLGLIIHLIFSYARNLRLLLDTHIRTLERVSGGDLSGRLPVVTNDEFGFIARHTNDMIQGLRHRTRLMAALRVAEGIQQNLLPQAAPDLPGGDVAGRSLYCDETGGDYYDYLDLPGGRLGVVVADAADHGIGSALFMATTRAFVRLGARKYEGPERLVAAINDCLTHDSGESGRFVSLFFLEIDPAARTLEWVRAGHEPGILYDPAADRFSELHGQGMALGVTADAPVERQRLAGWAPGTVVVLTTDGVRESRNGEGAYFGLERLHQAVRAHAEEPAAAIRDAVLSDLARFSDGTPREDDVTLVVIRLP